MQVVAFDTADPPRATAAALGVEIATVEELFRRSDFLVLCAPLTPDSRHMANHHTLGLMKDGSFLVNVGRGPLVDEAALVAALERGQIAAAALDVFEVEPLAPDSRLRDFDQCVFGSHNSSNTREGVIRASARAVDNLIAGLAAT